MAGSDKKPFHDESESTVRLDLGALNAAQEEQKPLLDVDVLLAGDADITFPEPDEAATPPAMESIDDDLLEQRLDELANDTAGDESDFEKTFAPAGKGSFDSDKTVILGPESMVSAGDSAPDRAIAADETVSISPPKQQVSIERPIVTPPEPVTTPPTDEISHEATQKLQLPKFDATGGEPHPDTEHPSWQYSHLEHPEASEHKKEPAAHSEPSPPKAATPAARPAAHSEPKAAAPAAKPASNHPATAHTHTTQASATHANIPAQPAASSGSRAPMLISLLVAIIGLAAGAAGVWMAMEADERSTALQQDLNALQQRMAQLRKQNPDVAPLQKRIEELEAQLAEAGIPGQTSAPVATPSKPAAKAAAKPEPKAPVAQPVPKPAAAPVTTTAAPRAQSDWVVYVSSHASKADAEKDIGKLKAGGIAAELRSAEVRGSTWYRVVISGFATKDEAARYQQKIERDFGIRGAWIGKQ